MTELVIHPDVHEEVQIAYDWYEQQVPGLGEDFLSELDSAFDSIKQLPLTWPRFGKQMRRFLLTKFPYAVVYRPGATVCFVVAVMHQSRRPGYWEPRS